jgi:hypothetical protein
MSANAWSQEPHGVRTPRRAGGCYPCHVPRCSRALLAPTALTIGLLGLFGMAGCSLTTALEGISDGVGDVGSFDETDATDATAEVAGDSGKADADAPADPCAEPTGLAWKKPVQLAGIAGPTADVPMQPYGLPDALSLLFVTRPADKGQVFLATRKSVTDTFAGATPLAFDAIDNAQFVATLPGLHEVMFGSAGHIWVGTRVGATGTYATRAYVGPVAGGVDDGESWPSLTPDGQIMAYARGPLFRWKLWEARRTNTSPGANWTSAVELAELNDAASSYVSICPAISADGLHLWFMTNQTKSALLYHAKRPTLDAKFGSPTPLAAFADTNPCPRSVSKNGCEMYLTCTVDGVDRACVSKRIGAP